MRILGIDYGTVRVGLALSDDMQLVASPFKTLANSKTMMPELVRIIRDKSVAKVVIGLPIGLRTGEVTMVGKEIEKFGEQLSKALEHSVTIVYADESLSSKIAERALTRDGKEIDVKSGELDQLAATVVLQEYLNHERGPESFLLPDDAFDMPWLDEAPKRKR